MDAFKLLFTSDIGLLSLGAIVFTIGIGVWFARWFGERIAEDERDRGKA